MMTDRRMKEMSELIATLQYEIQAPHDSSVERILALMRDELIELRSEIARNKRPLDVRGRLAELERSLRELNPEKQL